MITWELIIALVVYNFIMYVTPGPNNSILTASGIKFGFAKSIPNVLGIPTGHGLQLALVCLGLGTLFITYPILYDILRYVGSAYILYLAYKMFGSLNIAKTEDRSRPLKYYEAILFQFVNPKAWSIALTVASGFFPVEENIFIGVTFVTITAAVICFPSICVWALFGSALRKFVTNLRIKKNIEYLLAIMLVLTGLFILLK